MFREDGKGICKVVAVLSPLSVSKSWVFFFSSILLEFSPSIISCAYSRCNLKKLLPAAAFSETFLLRVFLLVFEAKVFHARRLFTPGIFLSTKALIFLWQTLKGFGF